MKDHFLLKLFGNQHKMIAVILFFVKWQFEDKKWSHHSSTKNSSVHYLKLIQTK